MDMRQVKERLLDRIRDRYGFIGVGVVQGDPLPYLLVLCTDPTADWARQLKEFEGLEIHVEQSDWPELHCGNTTVDQVAV